MFYNIVTNSYTKNNTCYWTVDDASCLYNTRIDSNTLLITCPDKVRMRVRAELKNNNTPIKI